MFYKYYTADTKTLNGEPLKIASLTIKVWRFTDPVIVCDMFRNQLDLDGLSDRGING